MAEYTLSCTVCGTPFQASRRDALACSNRCRMRRKDGGRPTVRNPDTSDRDLGPSSASRAPLLPPSGVRCYVLLRGPGAAPDVLALDKSGRVEWGAFVGRTIVELIKTAADKGWLAWRRRDDGWYATEWCPEHKTITLCGPIPLPGILQQPIAAEGGMRATSAAAFPGQSMWALP
jgi:hypothetical protein